MTKKIVLIPLVTEGDAGCHAKMKELGVGFGAPSRDVAIRGLLGLVKDHCYVLVSRGSTSQATPAQLVLAQSIVKNGVEFKE